MRLLLICLCFAFVSSCASKKEDKKEVRTFEKTYKVMDASLSVVPEWSYNPDSLKKGDFRYFVSDAKNKNQRLCIKSAEVRASAKIASEISQFIKNTYGESTQGGDSEVEEYMEESLAQEAQAFIVGAVVDRVYWERRKYMKEMGADENETIFNCFALIKMDQKNLKKAIDNSMRKLYSNIQNPEVKEKTQNILKDVADKFNALDAVAN